MKPFYLIISFIAFSVLAVAQSKTIEIGKIDTIESDLLHEKRPVWIYQPDDLSGNKNSRNRYPVVYLLDGDWHFVSVVGLLQQLSYINGNTVCPEMIVAGIPVKDRYRDFTPSCDSTFSNTSGGYEKFISFIEQELIPYIDSTYPTAPYKILIGHSLGGLAVINTLARHTKMFNAYVAIDPSVWWDNQVSLKETEKALSTGKFDHKTLFLAIANTLDAGMDTAQVRTDKTRNTLPIRSSLELANWLKKAKNKQLAAESKYYPNENHGSIPLIATYDALHFIFSFYNLQLTKKDYAATNMTLADRVNEHYKTVSEKMGYQIIPSENTINTLAYNALFMKNMPLAGYFFKLNVTNYPESFNGYDSLGDYYLNAGDHRQAAEMFRKALSIRENASTRRKLEIIQEKE